MTYTNHNMIFTNAQMKFTKDIMVFTKFTLDFTNAYITFNNYTMAFTNATMNFTKDSMVFTKVTLDFINAYITFNNDTMTFTNHNMIFTNATMNFTKAFMVFIKVTYPLRFFFLQFIYSLPNLKLFSSLLSNFYNVILQRSTNTFPTTQLFNYWTSQSIIRINKPFFLSFKQSNDWNVLPCRLYTKLMKIFCCCFRHVRDADRHSVRPETVRWVRGCPILGPGRQTLAPDQSDPLVLAAVLDSDHSSHRLHSSARALVSHAQRDPSVHFQGERGQSEEPRWSA